jgi:hypothetical protein
MLAAYALRHKEVTYIVAACKDVIPLLEAQGYRKFSSGRIMACPVLSFKLSGADVDIVSPEDPRAVLPKHDAEMLVNHAALGCISLVCNFKGNSFPFVFLPRRRAGVIRFARLIYCRELDDLVRFCRPLGRFLLRFGYPLIVIDANGPIRGIPGIYFDDFPKYIKGPDWLRVEDVAYSTRVIFDC